MTRWNPKSDINNQTQIFPGTENGERIRISAQLIAPETGADDINNWFLTSLEDAPDVDTEYKLWQRSIKLFGENQCLGKRQGEGAYTFLTYNQVNDRANKIATAFIQSLGMSAGNDTIYGMYSGNKVDWTVCGIAANLHSMIQVPLYDTLGEEAMRFISSQCNFELVVTDTCERAAKLIKTVHNHSTDGHKFKHLICMEELTDELTKLSQDSDIKIHNLDKLIENISIKDAENHHPPKSSDIFSICYTSGTTGQPKGVVHTHGAWIADMCGVSYSIPKINSSDCWLSYLPAAHVFERAVQSSVLCNGGKIGFYRGDVKLVVNDAAALQPTIFGGVPRVWNKIYAKLQAAESESFIKGILIRMATRNKVAQIKRGYYTRSSFWDHLVFKKIQALLGGKVRYAISGAAPIKDDVINTLRAAFGCYVFNGYGQTECGCCATLTLYPDHVNSIGCPVPCGAMKVVSVPDMNYDAKNDVGEICIKGPHVMREYYKNAEKTAETIDKDGWLHTGDIGKWLPNGAINIIDRKKHIFKLSQGEYIAPEKIENIYSLHPGIAQCFVYGDSNESRLVGVVMADPDSFCKWSHIDDFGTACKDENVRKRLLKEMTDLGNSNGLASFEQVKIIKVYEGLMSVENDLLTPTMKAKRPQITKYFKEIIDELYKELE